MICNHPHKTIWRCCSQEQITTECFCIDPEAFILFQIKVNGDDFHTFGHRLSVQRVGGMHIGGDVSIQTINIIGVRPQSCEPFSVMLNIQPQSSGHLTACLWTGGGTQAQAVPAQAQAEPATCTQKCWWFEPCRQQC